MKRTSLWEMKERVRGTRMVVVASWWMMAVGMGGRSAAVLIDGAISPW